MTSREQAGGKALNRSSLPVIAAIFVLTFAAAQVAIILLFERGHLQWLIDATAAATATLISLAGIPFTRAGDELIMTNHVLKIVLDCTGLSIAALYISLVVAYPLSTRTRTLAVVVGLPVIAVANMARLLGVAFASEYLSPGVFQFVHDYLFMVFMMLVVVGLWAAWLQMARAHATTA